MYCLALPALLLFAPQKPLYRSRRCITGNKLYNEAAIIAITGLRTGKCSKAKIESGRDKLLANGAFTNVSFRYDPAPSKKGYVVTFDVDDLEQLFEYRFDRLDADDAKLRAYLKQREPLFDKRIPGADTVLARFRTEISEYLKSQNKPAEVQGKVTTDAGEPFVLFSPPGQMPAVATVTFTGNKVVTLTELQNRSTLSPWARSSAKPASMTARDRRHPIHESRGRLPKVHQGGKQAIHRGEGARRHGDGRRRVSHSAKPGSRACPAPSRSDRRRPY
jgi:hypothetical protein